MSTARARTGRCRREQRQLLPRCNTSTCPRAPTRNPNCYSQGSRAENRVPPCNEIISRPKKPKPTPPPPKTKHWDAGSCPGGMSIAGTWLCRLRQLFHPIATRQTFLHVMLRNPFHLEKAVTSPFAAWYLPEMSNPNTLERENAFLFLRIALCLHRDGLVSSQEKSAD